MKIYLLTRFDLHCRKMQDGTLRVRQLQLQSSPHTLLPYPHSSLSADCSVQVYTVPSLSAD